MAQRASLGVECFCIKFTFKVISSNYSQVINIKLSLSCHKIAIPLLSSYCSSHNDCKLLTIYLQTIDKPGWVPCPVDFWPCPAPPCDKNPTPSIPATNHFKLLITAKWTVMKFSLYSMFIRRQWTDSRPMNIRNDNCIRDVYFAPYFDTCKMKNEESVRLLKKYW